MKFVATSSYSHPESAGQPSGRDRAERENDVMSYPSRIAVFIVVVALVFGSMVALQKMLGVIAYAP